MEIQASQDKILSILFSDLKGYSKLPDDTLMERAIGVLREEVDHHLLRSVPYDYRNTWGDAYLICNSNPTSLAEIALRMRDFVKTTNWKNRGLSDDFAIRIGLHISNVKVHIGADHSITDVIGVGVNTTARIEPITEPNKVYCSEKFHGFLDSQTKIHGIKLGKRQLAKEFGEMELFELVWKHEATEMSRPASVPANAIPVPIIKQKFGDKQKGDFLYKSFADIKSYFMEGMTQLEAANTGIESRLRPLNDTTFICEIYVDGKTRAQCKIWIGNNFGREQIHFSEERFNIENSNGINDAIVVEDDGTRMYLKSTFPSVFHRGYDTVTNPSSPEQIAEYLWERLTRPLNTR